MSKHASTDSRDEADEAGTESVGYGRPPRRSQFKKGQSGYRRGRPRERPNVTKAAAKLFDTKITVKAGEQTIKLPALHALVHVHKAKSLQGDRKSQKAMFVIMDALKYFDEKGEPETKGVLIIPQRGNPPNEDEWLWVSQRLEELKSARDEAARRAEQGVKSEPRGWLSCPGCKWGSLADPPF